MMNELIKGVSILAGKGYHRAATGPEKEVRTGRR